MIKKNNIMEEEGYGSHYTSLFLSLDFSFNVGNCLLGLGAPTFN